ncbi:hypothetical protein XPA_001510 [Xanthoria parietina]
MSCVPGVYTIVEAEEDDSLFVISCSPVPFVVWPGDRNKDMWALVMTSVTEVQRVVGKGSIVIYRSPFSILPFDLAGDPKKRKKEKTRKDQDTSDSIPHHPISSL